MTPQVKGIIAGLLIVVAVVNMRPDPTPNPSPLPAPKSLNLRGLFVGESAVEDAALLAALCDEIANEIEWDGAQPDPFLKTGVAFDELRTRARIARLDGESLGDRQPRVRDAVAAHLTSSVGVSGGPVDDAQRAQWVLAYREVAEACRDALGR